MKYKLSRWTPSSNSCNTKNARRVPPPCTFTDNPRYFFKLKCFCLHEMFSLVFSLLDSTLSLDCWNRRSHFIFVVLDEFSLLWQCVLIEDPSDIEMNAFKSPACLKRCVLTINSSDSTSKLSFFSRHHSDKSDYKSKACYYWELIFSY